MPRISFGTADFDYHLPPELIAQEPLADRAGSRMLVLHRLEQRSEDRMFRDFPEYLRAGDCLVSERFEGVPVATVRAS